MLLECNGPLEVKRLEVTVPGIGLESRQSLRDRVHRRLAVPLRLLQIGEVPALDPFVFGVVSCHDLVLPRTQSHCSRRAARYRLFAANGRTSDQHDAYSVAAWLRQADSSGRLARFLNPDLTPPQRTVAEVEGWILGVA
jgi:hypothetical protein